MNRQLRVVSSSLGQALGPIKGLGFRVRQLVYGNHGLLRNAGIVRVPFADDDDDDDDDGYAFCFAVHFVHNKR